MRLSASAFVCLLASLVAASAVAGPLDPPVSVREEPEPETRSKYTREDPSPGRLIISDTAFTTPKGAFAWQTLDVGLHRFDYGVTDNVQIGVTTVLPVMVFGALPEVKIGFDLSESVRLGLVARGGFLSTMVNAETFFVFGGGPMLTIGSEDLALNIQCKAYLAGRAGDDDLAWLAFPSIGGSMRVSNGVSLHAELGPVFAAVGDDTLWKGDLWGLMYGVRVFGEHLFGDFSFVIPASEDTGDILKYMPLGVPLLSFGYTGI